MQQASYFSQIPADVLNDKDLTPSAIILYAHLSMLTFECGYCWASNAYLGKRVGVSERTISRLLGILESNNHIIRREIVHNNKKVRATFVSLVSTAVANIAYDKKGRQKCLGGVDKNVPQRYISLDNKEKGCTKRATFIPPTLKELSDYISEKKFGYVDAKVFFLHYEQNEWKVGKGKMKSWKMAVSGWQARMEAEKKTATRDYNKPKGIVYKKV